MPKAATKTHSPKVGFVSLGCPKALVDSERILSQLRAEGYETAADYAGADVVVVNTCGFLDSARTESLEAIGEALAENGRVIVTGCLGAEANVIRDAHPNVLAITGPQQYEAVVTAVHATRQSIARRFDLRRHRPARRCATPSDRARAMSCGGVQLDLPTPARRVSVDAVVLTTRESRRDERT